jgi:hypothetical protein
MINTCSGGQPTTKEETLLSVARNRSILAAIHSPLETSTPLQEESSL